MIPLYQKLLEMESVELSKLEPNKEALERVRKILYQDKNFVIDRLITYLKRELDVNYFKYKVIDMDGNIADIIVKENSDCAPSKGYVI